MTTQEPKHHPDLHRKVMHEGAIFTVIGVTYSTRNTRGGWRYSLLPDGKHGLEHAIHDITVDKLAFDPPVMGDASTRKDEDGDSALAVSVAAASPATPYAQLVKG